MTHAAGGAADEDAAWQDKEKEAADSGESRVSEAENQSGAEAGAYGIRALPLAAALILFSAS